MAVTFDSLVKDMNKAEGQQVITAGIPTFDGRRIPFTSPRMNYCTFGGIPIGHITEFYGEEHGGKTTSALDIIANYQQMDGAKKVVYLDAEHTLDHDWAEKIGVDVDSMYYFVPGPTQSAEDLLQFVLDSIATGEIGLVIIDSIPALSSAQELGKDMDEKTYAGISSALTVFGRKVTKLLRECECTIIATNQLRDDLKSMYGGTKTPGGRAWKHFCSVRLEFTKGRFVDDKGEDMKMNAESPAGNYVLMHMEKNKTCPPTRRTGFYTIDYECGINYLKDLTDLAIKIGIVQKTGGWYSIFDKETGELISKQNGVLKVYEYLGDEENEEVLTMVEEAIDEYIK